LENGAQRSAGWSGEIGGGLACGKPEALSVCLSATDAINYRRLSPILRRAELDLALEYVRPDQRYGLLTCQHTKKAEKCDPQAVPETVP
jgi:hypothetical protein